MFAVDKNAGLDECLSTRAIWIYLYNTNGKIISLIMVNAKLLFHVESLMFDACSDKALLKSYCMYCKLFLLSSVKNQNNSRFTTEDTKWHFSSWVRCQLSLNIFSWD